MTNTPRELTMRVAEVQRLNPLIKHFVLRAADGAVLPAWAAGAHVQVKVGLPQPGVPEQWRHYSLIDIDGAAVLATAPTEYRIAVRVEDSGRGGSLFMHHQVQVGSTLMLREPANEFPLRPEAPRSVLIAGGIGVTPLISMASALKAQGADYRFHYSGRSRALLAFLPELEAQHGARLQVHADDEPSALNVATLLAQCSATDHLYVCGPKGLLDALLAQAPAHGINMAQLHFEVFTTAAPLAGDGSFELVLAQSGRSFSVPPNKTILEVLIDEGCDPMYDCQRGECGVCVATVLEGEIDHRDYCLSERERANGDVMQTCVSRCKGARLVLDL